VLKLLLSLLLGGPVLAWWPGRMPAAVRKIAACLTLAPVVLGFVFLMVALVTRPRQLAWPAGPLLLVFGTVLLAGAYALWPGARPRRDRVIAACFFVGPCLALFALALAVMEARGGTLYGKVTFKGQPVPSGKVLVISDGGVVCSGEIRPDGRYVVYRVPRGPARIAVATYVPVPPGPVPVPTTPYVTVPARYRDFDKSKLAHVVTGGGQSRNLDLQP
jgi:hypothetical protein